MFGYGGIVMNSYLKELRKKAGFKQCDVAEKLGITRDYVSMLERGKRRPGRDVVYKMAKLYEIPLDDIFLEINRTYSTEE